MRKKRVSVPLFLSIIIMLIALVRADEFYYYWDSATHGTDIYAPLGQSGCEAESYAEPTGLIRLRVELSPLTLWADVQAWADLYKTVAGQSRTIRPSITYEAEGGAINGGTRTITLKVIDKSTAETVGEWSQNLPQSLTETVTSTLIGGWFYAQSGREYWYVVHAHLRVAGGMDWAEVDYGTESENNHIKVEQLHIEYEAPPPGGGGGGECPYVSIWDGSNYVLDNNILPLSQLGNGADVEDYYRLEQTLVRQNGKYQLLISEFQREHSYLDQVKLLAVDHESDVNIAVAPDGEILTHKNPVAPLSAVDTNGTDRLDQIRYMDGNLSDPTTFFQGNEDDYLLLNFGQVNSGGAKLIVRNDMYCMIKCINVQVMDNNGAWQTVAVIASRTYWAVEGVNLSPYIVEDQDLLVRLGWTMPHKLDYVGLDTTKQDDYELHEANLTSATHSTQGDVKALLLEGDNTHAELIPGQQIELKFTLPNNSKQARTYILYTKGRYYTIQT